MAVEFIKEYNNTIFVLALFLLAMQPWANWLTCQVSLLLAKYGKYNECPNYQKAVL